MAQWNPNAYPRRVLLNQMQLAQLLNERRALNEWHAVRLFARAIYGEDVQDVQMTQSNDQMWSISASKMFVDKVEVDLQTEFWRSITAYDVLYVAQPSPNLVQDIVQLWVATLPLTQTDWERRSPPMLTYTGPLAVPQVMETENAYADVIGISLAEYQRAVERFTTFFPKVRVEPGLHPLIGYFHWQFRIGELSIEAVAERLNVFVFDLVQLWTQHDLEVYPEGEKGDYLIAPTDLARYLKQELALYANDPDEIVYDAAENAYALWSAPRSSPEHKYIFMQARIKANRIIIDIDHTDKPLFEALLHAGVPREQLVFAYLNNTRPLTYNPPEGS